MRTFFSPKNNPRVIIIQQLYGKFFNNDEEIVFPKHRFKKHIKDIVFGTIERNDIILDELNKNLSDQFKFKNLDKIQQDVKFGQNTRFDFLITEKYKQTFRWTGLSEHF